MNTHKYQSKNSQELKAIFWDYENVPQFNIASDLLKFSHQRGNVGASNAYSCNLDKKAKNHLQKQGFECIQVENPNKKNKNAVDFQIAIDCFKPIKTNSYPDEIILVTGDCYSLIVQENLKSENRKLIVFARRGSDCHSLKKEVDEFYYIDELPKLVINWGAETLPTDSYISYEEAVKCLIEAIQTASKSGKSTTIGLIAKLMCNNSKFPNYKNVSSIRKPDGSKFSKFTKFIDRVIEKGIIRKINQEIILVDEMKPN
ncbi:NYN domain-containing protein [Lyngbya sp. PCC 8106]|uniref:NYN domain-containing protein n=1 Tax=Lyngbya sp. (strain PCC 8106) TaxID=313612 RepID=UPI0000EA9703|nr:NYN domain-containing protein [Lyngbya sp. PCC 8106]EAW35677.1 hypothetical protein L8106_08411 [Lyngbya sp. PCC 8106]